MPFIARRLISQTRNLAAPAWYIALGALVTFSVSFVAARRPDSSAEAIARERSSA
jgi:hypothetical protein